MDYFGDGSGISPTTGKAFGVHIEYFMEGIPPILIIGLGISHITEEIRVPRPPAMIIVFIKVYLGNAGALFRLKENLSDDFLLLNADMIFDIDFSRMVSYHKSKGALATLFTICCPR